ncbi:MAG: type VII secretion protein EccC, partial [Mycobacteriaceae bacterium]|nr:type VII secretion protein EccC [Mycobacteriaceae bacterium]
ELRLGEPIDAVLVKPRMAEAVPVGRPGRGMIAQNYERMGVDPVGLHTLMARPATEAAPDAFDSRSVVQAVRSLAAGYTPARKVRRLPKQVSAAQLAALVAADGSTGDASMVWAMSETEHPVYFDGQHLVITGQSRCGRTTACATVMAEIARVYAPATDPAPADQKRPHAQVWLIDPRRQLPNVLERSYVHRFAYTATTIKQRMVELAGVLTARLPEDDLAVDQAVTRRWTGPEIFLVIDDAQRLPAGFDSPLEPIAQFVEAGADVGLRIIYTRLFGGFGTGVGTDPVLRMLRQANAPLLVMDSDPDEGFVRGKWKGHTMPPGRGFLMNTTESGIYVQVGDAQLAEADPR